MVFSMRCVPRTLPACGCVPGRQRLWGDKAQCGGHGVPTTEILTTLQCKWDLSTSEVRERKAPVGDPGTPGAAGRRSQPCARAWPRRRPPATGVAVRSRRPGVAFRGDRRSRRAGVSVSGANFRCSEVTPGIGAMSGDSSGRGPEGRGRGRGRDPHRDRTRSRSRSPLSPVSRRGAAHERREAAERPSLDEEEPSDSGDEMVDPASLEEEPDHGLCRQIRHQYRALINSVQRKAGRGAVGAGARRRPCAARLLSGAPGSAAPR